MADLESQLKFLREALSLLPAERDRYKQLAAGLRVLVCGFRQNRPLLLDLMDELEVGYLISPIADLPFPIQMVDEMDEEPDVDLSTMSMDEVWAYHRSRGKSYSLREYVTRGLAVYFDGRAYSYADLIRTLAEQSGLGHEDWEIDQNLPQMESFEIGGYQSQVAPLVGIAEHVIDASAMVVRKAIGLGYVPHYLHKAEDGGYALPSVRGVA